MFARRTISNWPTSESLGGPLIERNGWPTIPDWLFDAYLRDAIEQDDEITTRALLGVAERQTSGERNRRRIRGGAVADLVAFAAAGHRVGTVLVDAPWRIEGASALLPYQTISVDELKALPVAKFCAERCHVHVWTLANDTLWATKEILEHWGLRVVGTFVWAKDSEPIWAAANWRQRPRKPARHRPCMADDRFDDHGLRSWIATPRASHSQKPAEVYEMLERASPPPRIELFARSIRPGWFSWGHEIPTSLAQATLIRSGDPCP